MALEDLIGSMYQFNMGMPLQYANPYFQYMGNQANNMAGVGNAYQGNMGSIGTNSINQAGQLGSSAMGLYGGLANTQANMYGSEMPARMEMARFNALGPALSGLLGQFGGNGAAIGSYDMKFDRPDVMKGYQGAVDNSYNQLGNFTDKAYGQAGNAYDRTAGGVQGYDKEFKNQWGHLQKQAMPNYRPFGAPAAPTPASPAPTPPQWSRSASSNGYQRAAAGQR